MSASLSVLLITFLGLIIAGLPIAWGMIAAVIAFG